MASHSCSLRALTDADLLIRLGELVRQENAGLADVVEHLSEVDRRDIVLDRGYPSLFTYCLKALGYTEAESYLRIRAARAARQFPRLLTDLREGRIRLDAIARLYPYLTVENNASLLDRAAGANRREIQTIVAQLDPVPAPARDVVLPVAAPLVPTDSSSTCEVLAPPQHRFHFTGDSELLALIEKLRGLLRHKHPDGRIESIFKEAATSLVEKIEKDRRSTRRPGFRSRSRKRYIPKDVRSEVWRRDGGRCAFVADDGRRCDSRDAL